MSRRSNLIIQLDLVTKTLTDKIAIHEIEHMVEHLVTADVELLTDFMFNVATMSEYRTAKKKLDT